MINTTNFSALPHASLDNHYRVPLVVDGNTYVIYVGREYIRRYTDDDLPDFIRAKITMAKVRGNNIISDGFVNWYNVYSYTGESNSMEGIAWQVSDSVYVVVITQDELDFLKGESATSRNDK
jgi:hypothetical protein